MLPTEPKSKLTVSQSDKSMFKSARTAMPNNPLLQFANKSGKLIKQHPFWLLVIGSVGIHTVFALAAPNPIQKPEIREVVISTLPVVKLPPKPLPTNSKTNKSPLDNLFVKTMPKSGLSQNPFPNMSSNPLTTLNLDDLSSFEGLQPVTDPYSVPALTNDADTQQLVKQQTSTPKNPLQRFTQSGQIDNTTPVKLADNSKPEFKNDNLRNDGDLPPSPKKNNGNNQSPDKVPTNQQGVDGNPKVKSLSNAFEAYSDPRVDDFRRRKLLRTTEIAHPDALLSDPDNNKREKGVEVGWIPPKRANTTGKSGTVTFIWLVDPNGKIDGDTVYVISSGITELDDIAREAAKGYKFKPIEDPHAPNRTIF